MIRCFLEKRCSVHYNESSSFFGKAKALYTAYERAFYLLVRNQTDAVLARMNNVMCLTPSLSAFKVHQFDKWKAMRAEGLKEAERFFAA